LAGTDIVVNLQQNSNRMLTSLDGCSVSVWQTDQNITWFDKLIAKVKGAIFSASQCTMI